VKLEKEKCEAIAKNAYKNQETFLRLQALPSMCYFLYGGELEDNPSITGSYNMCVLYTILQYASSTQAVC
jgi:hypothetical protein